MKDWGAINNQKLGRTKIKHLANLQRVAYPMPAFKGTPQRDAGAGRLSGGMENRYV